MHRQQAASRSRAGFTLMEVSLAIAVIVIALLAMSASTLRTHSLRRQNREKAVAQNAVRMTAESIQSLSTRIGKDEGRNWGLGVLRALSPGGEVGDEFVIPELNTLVGSETVGSIQVIMDERTQDNVLGIQMGMPRDLNGDGDALDENVTANARMLPVILTARWTGVSGTNVLRHPFYLIRY